MCGNNHTRAPCLVGVFLVPERTTAKRFVDGIDPAVSAVVG